jgi:ParB family transcriptional regulator, chromosome partitioning protein
LVRPLPDGESGTYELVAGARRFRASLLAKRETVPATIRELADAHCREIQLIENLQRAGVHELDEAEGYAALMQVQPEVYTVEAIALKVGKSPKYVCGRLKLISLIPDAKQAFSAGKLTAAHALR